MLGQWNFGTYANWIRDSFTYTISTLPLSFSYFFTILVSDIGSGCIPLAAHSNDNSSIIVYGPNNFLNAINGYIENTKDFSSLGWRFHYMCIGI